MKNKHTILKEADEMEKSGYVATDDRREAEDLAKRGVKVKLTKEQEGIEFSKEETQIIAKEIGKVLIDSLREVGDEITSAKGRNIQPNAFDLYIKYANDFEDTFKFYIDQDTLHLVDDDFDKEIGDVGIKPSGEPIVHSPIIKNNLLKHFKSLNEDIDWEDFEKGSREVEYQYQDIDKQDDTIEEDKEEKRQKYLTILDMYKRLSGKDKEQFKPKLEKAAKDYGLELDLSEQSSDTTFKEGDLVSIDPNYGGGEGNIVQARHPFYGVSNSETQEITHHHFSDLSLIDEQVIQENINPEVIKLVNRFVGGLAKRYGYDNQSAVNAIMTVLRKQGWEGVNEEFNPSIAPGSTYAIELKETGNKVALIQDNGQEIVVHKEDIQDLIQALTKVN